MNNDDLRRDIEHECRQLILSITQFGDHREAEKAAALFAPDGSWLRGGVVYTGPDEIQKTYGHGSPTQVVRHINGGTVVTVVDEDHAESVTYYLAINDDPGVEATPPFPMRLPFSMGEWHDKFVRTPDGWRFAARATKRIFERPKVS